ncbi:GNAT family N-acetyltransferase [candidate division GN15 bacterium]|nr:GNAT family N-acetyltransferase [candidate division GN15 bacterium]
MESSIRPLTIDHYDDILRVWMDAGLPIKRRGREGREMVEAEMARDYVGYFGLFMDDRLVGVAIAQFEGRHGWISRLAVEPDYRGRELAGKLILACEEFLAQFGDELVISALVEDDNAPSMDCLRKAGFVCHPAIRYWSKRGRPDL